MSNTQTELNDGAPQNLVSGRSGEETEKVDKSGGHTRDGHNAHRHIEDKDKSDMTTAGATPDRCSSKRPADNTNFSEDSEGVPRPEKARRRGQSASPDYCILQLLILERPYLRDR